LLLQEEDKELRKVSGEPLSISMFRGSAMEEKYAVGEGS
jgi:hypothetical protein